MILADTSAWIEYLRGTGSEQHQRLRTLLVSQADVALTEPVAMEVLAGATSEARAAVLRRLLGRGRLLHLRGMSDFESAAHIYRVCRGQGETIRSLVDCLVAAVAMRADAAILHRDRDFAVIARHLPLQLA